MRMNMTHQVFSYVRTSAITVGCLFLLVLATVSASDANFIDVIAQQYAIGGNGSVIDVGTVSYDLTSSNPVSQNFSVSSCCNPGGFVVMNGSATGEVASSYASVSISRFFEDAGFGHVNSGYAVASMTFFPLVNSMLLTPDIEAGMGAKGTIFDVTTGSVLYFGGALSFTPTVLSFNLGDIYIMSIASSTDGEFAVGDASLLLQPVPEPATLSLLGLGLAGLAGLRRKSC